MANRKIIKEVNYQTLLRYYNKAYKSGLSLKREHGLTRFMKKAAPDYPGIDDTLKSIKHKLGRRLMGVTAAESRLGGTKPSKRVADHFDQKHMDRFLKKQLGEENLHEISAKLAARYLVRRGVMKLEPNTGRMIIPSKGYEYEKKKANQFLAQKDRRSLTDYEKAHIRKFNNVTKGTERALKRVSKGAKSMNDVKSKLFAAERDKLAENTTTTTRKPLHEISAKLAARYLVRRGAIFVDSRKKSIRFPSQQYNYLEKNAQQAVERAKTRGHATHFEKETIRAHRKVTKATNYAIRKIHDKYAGPNKTGGMDKVRDVLLDAEKERLTHALLVGKTPTIKMQVKHYANKPTTVPPEELNKPKFKDIRKKEHARAERDMPPITHIEPDVPTQHHVVTSAGRVMFSGSRDQAHKTAFKVAGNRTGAGAVKVIETNHPKVKVGARLSSSEIKELERMTKRRSGETNESFQIQELSNGKLIKYLGASLRDKAKATDIRNAVMQNTKPSAYTRTVSGVLLKRVNRRTKGAERAITKLEKRGVMKTEEVMKLDELGRGTLINYAVKAEKAFRSGADKRAPGLKKVMGLLRKKGV